MEVHHDAKSLGFKTLANIMHRVTRSVVIESSLMVSYEQTLDFLQDG
jgi:hypothetical protein